MEKKDIEIEKIMCGIKYEMSLIHSNVEYIDTLQDDILVKMIALRIALSAPMFKDNEAKRALDNIYDNMYDISNAMLEKEKESKANESN